MKILVITASRYGSTHQGGEWIAQRLKIEGHDVEHSHTEEAPRPHDHDLIVLGSGLYAHKLLPGINDYVDQHRPVLRARKTAVFALAMRTSPVFVKGKAHGGLSQLEYLLEILGPSAVHAEMLGGEMVFSKMSEQDATGLLRFYAMLKLSDAEIERRKQPRTLMNKIDYWQFAETVMRQCEGTHEVD
jgi:menaquinone-dependent protoporphyrinogen IX oxidase